MGIIFRMLKFQVFFGVLEIPDFFGGEWRVDASSLRMKKNWEYPPWEQPLQEYPIMTYLCKFGISPSTAHKISLT